jgi:hypothetical protein
VSYGSGDRSHDPSRGAPSPAFLVGADQHRLGEDVSLHRFLQRGLVRALEFRQDGVERVELVEVAVPPESLTPSRVPAGSAVDLIASGKPPAADGML